MLVLISPSKNLNEKVKPLSTPCSIPEFSNEAKKIIKLLKKLNVQELSELMGISPNLAELNFNRYRNFKMPFTVDNAKAALFLFNGDVYQSLKVIDMNLKDIQYANENLRILSGLYGLLKPLDLIQPYRLEMGVKLQHSKGNNLYTFWGNKITKKLNRYFQTNPSSSLINLASKEYFHAVDFNKIKGKVITPHFREFRNGELRLLSFNAKKARGLMTRHIIINRITQPEDLKLFKTEGYYFDEKQSSESDWIFIR